MILTLIQFYQGKHESGMFELVDRGNQHSDKEVDWQKYFVYFEITKILGINVFKYKMH